MSDWAPPATDAIVGQQGGWSPPETDPTVQPHTDVAGYAKTIANTPMTALSYVLGGPVELANLVAKHVEGWAGSKEYKNPIPGGVQDMQRWMGNSYNDLMDMLGAPGGHLKQSDMFGAANPQSAGQQEVSALGAGALTGGWRGVTSVLGAQAGQGLTGSDLGGLAGGMAVPGVSAAGMNLTKSILTAPDTRAAYERNLAVGAGPGTVGSIGNEFAQSLEQAVAKAPGGARTIYDAVGTMFDGIRNRWNTILDNISQARGADAAGHSLVAGAPAWSQAMAQQTNQLYDAAANAVQPGTEGNIQPIIQTINNLTTSDPNLKSTTNAMGTNTKTWLSSQKASLLQDAINYNVQQGLSDGSIRVINPRQIIDPADIPQDVRMSPNVLMMQNLWTKDQVFQLPDGRYVPKADISELLDRAKTGNITLPYSAIDSYTRLLGQRMNDPSLVSEGLDQGAIKATRGAAATVRTDAIADNPTASNLLQLANSHYAASERLRGIVNPMTDATKSGGYDAAFNRIWTEARANGSEDAFRTAISAVAESDRPMMAATMLDRMGRISDEQTTPLGNAKWSPMTFMTQWGRLNPEARQFIAGQLGPDYAQSMDQLSTWAARLQKEGSVYNNPSGTAAAFWSIAYLQRALQTAGAAMGAGVGAGAMEGNVHGGAIAGAVGAGAKIAWDVGATRILAKAFTNPTFVKWLATGSTMPKAMAPQMVATLGAIAQRNNDPDLKDIAHMIQVGMTGNAAQPPQQAQ